MNRRTFVLLTGAASTGWLRRPGAPARPATGAVGTLRFELDDHRRWSLWYHGDAPPLALIRDAELVAWVGEQPLTLAQLEDSTVGSRRPPSGEAVVVRGRAAGVWVEAEFLVAPDPAAPQAAITVTVFPDRYLPTVKGVRFLGVRAADLLPGPGPLVALVNGYESRDPCRVVAAGPAAAGAASHGAIGLTRGSRGLAMAFDAGEPGEAQVALAGETVEAVSHWLPTRPLRPAGDASRLRLCFVPAGDGLDALRTVYAPLSPLDRERLAQAIAPTGWHSGGGDSGGEVTEAAVLANLEFCAAHFDRRFLRYMQIGDGAQRALGDWDAHDTFPRGHRWITDRIHAAGFQAGLWTAPFAVAEGSGVPAAHPDWLLQDASGPVVWGTREAWGGKLYALDGAHPKVQQWLSDLARRVVRDWGYDCLEIDLLRCATLGAAHYGGLTHAEAYRAGLGALRDGLGTEALLVANGAPLQHAAGLVTAMRIGTDAGASWGALQRPARAAGLRSFYHRSAWLNDPGGLVVGPPLTLSEAQAWASLVAMAGGPTWFTDTLPRLDPERVAVLARTLPVAPVAGRPVDATTLEREAAPGVVLGDDVYPVSGPWRFRTGDDPQYGTRAFDEDAWEPITVPGRWADAGHAEYVGFAWYRTRFRLPPAGGGASGGRTPYLELGKVDAVDETFLNGVRIGQHGEFPPSARGDGQAYRRYPVPSDLLNWGGENVLAVRVYAGSAAGGLWSVRRERPPGVWVAEGAPRWWTVVLVNWDDEPQELALALPTLGITGATFDAYDVWRDAPLTGPKGTLTATLAPHSALTLALRAAAARPQVIGTSRHVIQGSLDLVDETWDGATRTLRAKSVNLDSRAYAVTIAVPKGMRAGPCHADVPCTVRRLPSGHAVLEWPAGGDARDIAWEVRFPRTPARPGRGLS